MGIVQSPARVKTHPVDVSLFELKDLPFDILKNMLFEIWATLIKIHFAIWNWAILSIDILKNILFVALNKYLGWVCKTWFAILSKIIWRDQQKQALYWKMETNLLKNDQDI